MKKTICTAALMAASIGLSIASAQVPGMPVRPVTSPVVVTEADMPAEDAPMLSNGDAIAAAAELRDQLVSTSGALPSAPSSSTGRASRPAPSNLRLQSGRNEMVQVARGQPNRFLTPFAAPVARFSNPLTSVDIEGRMVYVTTSSPTPVTVYIEDDNNADNAFVLTLTPREVPAVSITLHMDGVQAGHLATSKPAAQAFEKSDHFVAVLRDAFKELAAGRVPAGYGLATGAGRRDVPECLMPGMRMVPGQTVTGNEIVVYVARLTNTTGIPQSVDEESCASDRVLAVAAWPHVELMPGESTELYIAMRQTRTESGTVRPSLIN